MELKVKIKLTRGMEAPTYATENAAAVDLRAALEEGEEVVIAPGERRLIPTGISISPEDRNTVAVIAGRSGLGIKNGVTLANGIGLIDADYRGEIQVGLINRGNESFKVHRNDRIAQMMFLPVYHAAFLPCEELDETERGAGGFGSTGIG